VEIIVVIILAGITAGLYLKFPPRVDTVAERKRFAVFHAVTLVITMIMVELLFPDMGLVGVLLMWGFCASAGFYSEFQEKYGDLGCRFLILLLLFFFPVYYLYNLWYILGKKIYLDPDTGLPIDEYMNPDTSLVIEIGETHIVAETFNDCPNPVLITIPGTVETIEKDVFWSLTRLTGILAAADNIRYSSCHGVLFDKNKTTLIRYPNGRRGTYSIPNTVSAVEQAAFYGCVGLRSVTIPDSVQTIGDDAFHSCPRLTSVTSLNPVPPNIGQSTFFGPPSNMCLYVLKSSIDAYRSTKGWNHFKRIKAIESTPGGE